MSEMMRVEFHCHTRYSKDSLTKIPDLIAAAKKKGIDKLVVTDHNTIAGAVEAKLAAPERIIVGEEIMTQEGELLAAFVKEEIQPGLPVKDAIRALKDQGAFISVSHPFDRYRGGGWQRNDLLKIMNDIDAIEVFNARCFPSSFNKRALKFAKKHQLLGTVGSDAHTTFELGRATMLLPDFDDAEGLRKVLPEAVFDTRLSSPLVRFSSRYAVMRKKFSLA